MYTNLGNKANVHETLNLNNSPEKTKLKKNRFDSICNA